MSATENKLIEATINLENMERVVVVHEEDIKEFSNFIELLKNNKKLLLGPAFFNYRNFYINDLFMKMNTMIGRYRCQNVPTARRLRTNKQVFEKYDEIMNDYVPKIKENIRTIWRYVSRNTDDDGFYYENGLH